MEFCDCAIDLSLNSTHKVFKHGSVLVRNGHIVGMGYNDQCRHAEENAIRHCVQRVLSGT